MKVITRFAPSPTGFLHIGGARTALFNYLFAKRFNGQFFLRIEDTDKQRSTPEAIEAIVSGLKWLGLNWDPFSQHQDCVYQSQRIERHQQVGLKLLSWGKAYKCFVSSNEIKAQKEAALQNGKSFLFSSPWRDVPDEQCPKDKPYVIRFKTPKTGSTVVNDLIHGKITFENNTLEDLVLLRSDMEPLYNLCVVCDDYDMSVTHVIRGDDHITNAARQQLLYDAMGWAAPQMAHIPLIHGPDGAKLSKRHGATNVADYQDLGYLPDALINYILRLGWSFQGDEIISLANAAKIFDLAQVGKSSARIDFDKMKNINAQYIKAQDDKVLTQLVIEMLATGGLQVNSESRDFILKGMSGLKVRASLTTQLVCMAKIYLNNYPIQYTLSAKEVLLKANPDLIAAVIDLINDLINDIFDNPSEQSSKVIQNAFNDLAAKHQITLSALMQPVRCLITGSTTSPSVFEIIAIIGKAHTIDRLMKFKS
jgi:glutamyl-tRNA synthetase